jgi:hypothetical protein
VNILIIMQFLLSLDIYNQPDGAVVAAVYVRSDKCVFDLVGQSSGTNEIVYAPAYISFSHTRHI